MRVLYKFKLSSFQLIMLGFAAVILVGALLLMLPISTKEGVVTPFLDAIFTSTSAVCVTGLVVHDTATYWSYFGQAVILCLIQVGGMGVVTMVSMVTLLAGKKIGLGQRSTMVDAISAPMLGGIVRRTLFIIKGILLIELIGALLMMPTFCIDFGPRGIWMAFFHSISAFCNAGFDLMGETTGAFSSLTGYASDPVIPVVVMLLIVLGGIGFLTWEDISIHKWRLVKYRTQSKLVLLVTLILILLPAVYFFFFEFEEYAMGERILLSLFQSVTPRTAGFNTADMTLFGDVGTLIVILLMLIGGSSGSTAGGMKVTTMGVLFASASAAFHRRESAQMFKRRLSDEVIKNAATICFLYLILFITGGALISTLDGVPLLSALYEAASALGTVGLSLGFTPTLGPVSRMILIFLMYLGRIGGLTLIYATFGSADKKVSKWPIDKIMVG